MVGSAMVGPAIVMEIMAMETVTIGQEYRTADKQRPIEPRVPPIVRLGVGIQIDGLWRQRVDLLRQSRRIQRDLPAPIRLLARLPDGLSPLAFNRHLCGEVAAILKGDLCWDECCVRRARGNLPGTARQDRHHCDTQKGMRTSISRNEGGTSRAPLGRHVIPKASMWRHSRCLLFERQRRRTAPTPNAGSVWRGNVDVETEVVQGRRRYTPRPQRPPSGAVYIRRGIALATGGLATARPPHFTQRGPRSQNPHTRTNAAGSYALGQRRIPAHVSASSRLTNSHNSPSRPPQSEHLSGSECNGVMSLPRVLCRAAPAHDVRGLGTAHRAAGRRWRRCGECSGLSRASVSRDGRPLCRLAPSVRVPRAPSLLAPDVMASRVNNLARNVNARTTRAKYLVVLGAVATLPTVQSCLL